MNGTNDTRIERTFIASYYGVLSVCGFILVAIVLTTTIIQKHSHLNPFYILLICINFAEAIIFLVYIAYAIPCIVLGDQIYGITIGNGLSFILCVAHVTVSQCTVLISLNRCLTIVSGSVNDKIFTRTSTICYVIIMWINSCILQYVAQIRMGCQIFFSEKYYAFFDLCLIIDPTNLNFAYTLTFSCTVGTAIFYIIAFAKLWKTRKQVMKLLLEI